MDRSNVISILKISMTAVSGSFFLASLVSCSKVGQGLVLSYLNSSADFADSSITSNGPQSADGASDLTLTVSLQNADHSPVIKFTPEYSVVSGSDVISFPCSPTDSDGISTCILRSTSPGLKTIALTNLRVAVQAKVLFLHKITGTPTSIFSLRLMAAEYRGALILVRRSQDNLTTSVGFGTDGLLDVDSLLSFCGAGSCYIQTWFDQSGNANDATQANQNFQPRIVLNGSLDTMNGRPALTWSQTDGTGGQALLLATGMRQSVCAVRDSQTNGDSPDHMQYLFSTPANSDTSIRFASARPNYYGDDNFGDFGVGGATYVGGVLTKSAPTTPHQLCVVAANAAFDSASIGSLNMYNRNLYGGDHVGEVIIYNSSITASEAAAISEDQKAAWHLL